MSATPRAPARLPSRRERKKQATRRALEEAAFRLFARRGFSATTVEQITEEADVSIRTFHHHFSGKEDVLFGDLRAIEARFAAALAATPEGADVFDAVRRAVLAIAPDYAAQRSRHLLREALAEANPSIERWRLDHLAAWEADLEAFVAERLGVDPTADLRPGLLARGVLGALRTVHGVWIAHGAGDDLEALLEEAFDRLGRGFAGLRG